MARISHTCQMSQGGFPGFLPVDSLYSQQHAYYDIYPYEGMDTLIINYR